MRLSSHGLCRGLRHSRRACESVSQHAVLVLCDSVARGNCLEAHAMRDSTGDESNLLQQRLARAAHMQRPPPPPPLPARTSRPSAHAAALSPKQTALHSRMSRAAAAASLGTGVQAQRVFGLPSACLGLCPLAVHQRSWPSPSSGKAMQTSPKSFALEMSISTSFETPVPTAAERMSSWCLREGLCPEQGPGHCAAAAPQAQRRRAQQVECGGQSLREPAKLSVASAEQGGGI